jgi:BirA family biotin operon repressor/biotin-[acetyl-CoA-carboxylase] ligase
VQGLAAHLRRNVAALDQVLRPLPERNVLIGALGRELLGALQAFDASGFEPFLRDWDALHAFAGQRLRVRLADGRVVAGLAEGLAADGALQLRTRGGVRTVRSGRVVSTA